MRIPESLITLIDYGVILSQRLVVSADDCEYDVGGDCTDADADQKKRSLKAAMIQTIR